MAQSKDTAVKTFGIAVVRAGELSDQTAQSEGMPRLTSISEDTPGVKQLWVGRVTGEPGMNSQPHHHGEAQTVGYVLSGKARIYYGDTYEAYVDLHPGDFIFVPPYVPHIESNPFDEPVEFVTIRTPDNIVVNLADASKTDGNKHDYGISKPVTVSTSKQT